MKGDLVHFEINRIKDTFYYGDGMKGFLEKKKRFWYHKNRLLIANPHAV